MAKKVIMPKFGMDQEEGTVSAWLKQEGDSVEKGEPILEVETDKVNMEVEANASGILAGLKVGPGDTVPIGQIIAYILNPGEALPVEKPALQKTNEAVEQTRPPLKATPLAERVASQHGLDLQTIAPDKQGQRITRFDVEARLDKETNGKPPVSTAPDKVRAVPAARRLARQLGLDLATVSGSGPGGRIQSHDVRRAAEAEPLMVTPALVAETPSARVISRQIPLSRMRRIIADRLTASQRDVPQFIVSMAVEMSRAQQMIADLATASDEVRVTLTAFLIKACGWALKRHPALNASFGPEAITEWADINIGMAVSVEQGLVVPVIRQADRLPILEIARQVAELGQRARQGKLQPHEMQDGTFTISNLGMFGVDHFTAIINPPEAAILAVSRAAKVPVVSDDDKIEIKLLADLTLTADHRVVDGAQAAQFLAALKQAIERPGLLL